MSRRLSPCPRSWTCVVSRDDAARRNRVQPFGTLEDPDGAFACLKRLVVDTPRTRVVTATDDYLHAICRTRIGFPDDLELLLCRRQRVIHVRSASRYGLFDFGVNRRRVERLRQRFADGPETGRARAG